MVNQEGLRFYDEGEDFWPKRYAIWGRLVAQQPGQIGHVIIDQKAVGRFMPPVFPATQADTIPDLARALGLDPQVLDDTVQRFNAAVRPGRFDHTILDDCATEGLKPAKTHWARPIDTPPFLAYSLRPGITFTYLGVVVDAQARMLMADDGPFGQCLRRRRDHGRQRARQGLSRRDRHDDRDGVRPDRRRKESAARAL